MKKSVRFIAATAAVLVLSALTASSAFATKGEWDWAWHHTQPKIFALGSQVTQNVFTVSGGNIKCTTAQFHGSAEGTTVETVPSGEKDYAVHIFRTIPTFSGCTAFGQAATVTTTGCFMEVTPKSATAGTVQLACEAGKSIVVKANTAGCTITIGAQTPTTPTIDFKVEGTGETTDVLMTPTVEGVTYTSSGGICGSSGTNGKYTGSITMKGFSDEAHTKQMGLTFVETVS